MGITLREKKSIFDNVRVQYNISLIREEPAKINFNFIRVFPNLNFSGHADRACKTKHILFRFFSFFSFIKGVVYFEIIHDQFLT